MRLAACQLPFVHGDLPRALALIELHAMNAQRQGAELVCFPECFLQGYDVSVDHVAAMAIDLASPEFERILRRLADVVPVIVLGLIEKDAAKFYNTAAVLRRGALVTRYRKCHLIGAEHAIFEPGREYPVFQVGGIKVGMNICYDLRFAESIDAVVSAGAELVACPCNNMLRPSSAEDWKFRHNEIRCERARDARVWIASADIMGEYEGRISYGPTAVIDPGGGVVAQVPLMTTGMVVVDLPEDPDRLEQGARLALV
jgi:predicted amidohydrolase